jgi:glycosyltransferase involved in cell wall biosynthesis
MTSAPRVAVGLPVYNGERYLREALDSVLGQTWWDFELIVSDNGSADATPDICSDYAARDERVRYVRHEQNRGAAWNFNHVVRLARSPYFKWLNHDDRWDPVMLERSVEALDDAPDDVVLCYPGTLFIDEAGRVTERYDDRLDLRCPEPADRLEALLRNLRRCNALFGLVRTERLRRTRLLGGYIDADRVLLAELSMLGQLREMDEPLFLRRMHARGSTFANVTRAQIAAWWDPGSGARLHFPNWRLLAEHLRAIRHLPLASAQRRRCYARVVRAWPGVYGSLMVGDLKAAVHRLTVAPARARLAGAGREATA